ncbi:MAG: AAA family ATPase [Prevotella sp.]|nr:AAA family ATPase [Prevotella sp.]
MNTYSPILELQRQRFLLQMEYAYEKETFTAQSETFGIERRAKRGDAWMNVRIGKSYFNPLNQRVVEVFRTQDQDVEHNFEFGKPVMLGKIVGTVSYVDGDKMVISVADNAPLADLNTAASGSIMPASGTPVGSKGSGSAREDNGVHVQLSFDETSYRTMFDALERVMRASNNRLAYLRDLFYTRQKAEKFSFGDIRFPWLNATQEQAVNEVLRAKDVVVVHGPPGTGKTTTLVEAIHETLRRENQVLVCAQSNMAVDWISERLIDRGINVLRIGNPVRVDDKMLSFTYERRFEAHPDYPQLWALRKAIRELRSRKGRRDEHYHQKLESLKGRTAELEIRINAELFGEARVIASTLVGSANRLLDGMKFTTLFIDEAAQAMEAACWIPIRRGSRVVFAGDHCQLPPTVKSVAALKGGLGKTLMERIVEQKPEVVRLLRMQYRMNEEIMRFSSDWFYDGKVECAPEVRYRGILDYDLPIEWLAPEKLPEEPDNTAGETFIGASFGRINKAEADMTLDTLEQYFNKIGKLRILEERIDVGIISPYRAQVQYLRSLIRKRQVFKPYRQLISVNTVDGFQGQERDVILISLVRSNDEGQIGFLRDLRRMNVAITRARMKLIILGDPHTLCRHPFYKKLYEYVEALRYSE